MFVYSCIITWIFSPSVSSIVRSFSMVLCLSWIYLEAWGTLCMLLAAPLKSDIRGLSVMRTRPHLTSPAKVTKQIPKQTNNNGHRLGESVYRVTTVCYLKHSVFNANL